MDNKQCRHCHNVSRGCWPYKNQPFSQKITRQQQDHYEVGNLRKTTSPEIKRCENYKQNIQPKNKLIKSVRPTIIESCHPLYPQSLTTIVNSIPIHKPSDSFINRGAWSETHVPY